MTNKTFTIRGRTFNPDIMSDEEYLAMKEQEQAIERADRIDTYRNQCFTDKTLKSCTFDKDDLHQPEISAVARDYVSEFSDNKAQGKGLLLFGSVGTGKTFMAACIANALVNQCFSCYMTTFVKVLNDLEATGNKNEYLKRLMQYDLLIIDDLSAERNTSYMNETVYTVIDERYRSGKPIIVTTNLTWNELKKPNDVTKERIISRLFEMCKMIHFVGVDRRKEKFKASYKADRDA